MNKTDLIQKLKQLDGLTPNEKADLINLVNTNKKYGLVWEDKPEEVEEQLRKNLPVLTEVVEKRITASPTPPKEGLKNQPANGELFEIVEVKNPPLGGRGAPNHILIEGDNLHALTALTFTHEGKFDVIYIDPPYNTGNKDFKYNDRFIDKEDGYRHSKWLSFMNKRLQIAKKLLSEKGVLFISIDDNEQAQLKLLCDEIFGQDNFVGTIPTIMNLKGNHDNYGFSDTHEYFLVYTKIKEGKEFGQFSVDETDLEIQWNEDENGYWKKADTLRRTGQDASRSKRPKGWFPIFITPTEEIYITEDDLPTNKQDYILLPINDDGEELSWTWQKSKIKSEKHNLIVTKARNGGLNIYKKQRPQIGDLPSKKPKSFFYKSEYSTSTSTNFLKEILKSKKFEAPKPVYFLKDILIISNSANSTILDFFAGSGTTLHATMQLNAEDGGNRQCIMVTNNENNICEEVTYERNKRVIQGYTNAKGEAVAGLTNNNLRYYKSTFVPSNKSEHNRRLLTTASTELLSIKEDCFTDVTKASGLNEKQCRVFTNDKGKYVVVVYHNRDPLAVCEQLTAFIKTIDTTSEKVRLYGFSPERETLVEDFYEVAEKIEALPLPDAIYNAYRATFRVLKLDKKAIAKSTLPTETEATLFTNTQADT